MKTKMLLTLSAVALILTGCEVSKEEVMKKNYVLIAQNVESMACSFLTIGYIVDEFGLKGANYHEDSDSHATCSDYGKVKNENCGVTELKNGDKGFGGSACAIGADSLNGDQDENATKKQKYIYIVRKVNPDLCGKHVIGKIAEDNGYSGNIAVYTPQNNVDCGDFPDATCDNSKVLDDNNKAYGDSICVVGAEHGPN